MILVLQFFYINVLHNIHVHKRVLSTVYISVIGLSNGYANEEFDFFLKSYMTIKLLLILTYRTIKGPFKRFQHSPNIR